MQDLLEQSLRAVLSVPDPRVFGQGRTDAGVHALKQVAHFDCDTLIPTGRLPRMLNKRLVTHGVVVLDAQTVPETFHARFSASSRTYCYVLYDAEKPPPIYLLRYCYHVATRFDADLVSKAITGFVGKHDFAAFCSSDWEGDTTVRRVTEASILIDGPWIRFLFKANAFLHNMVRHIVGLLLEVGRGKQSKELISTLLANPDPAASSRRPWNLPPAKGLFLIDVEYTDEA